MFYAKASSKAVKYVDYYVVLTMLETSKALDWYEGSSSSAASDDKI